MIKTALIDQKADLFPLFSYNCGIGGSPPIYMIEVNNDLIPAPRGDNTPEKTGEYDIHHFACCLCGLL